MEYTFWVEREYFRKNAPASMITFNRGCFYKSLRLTKWWSPKSTFCHFLSAISNINVIIKIYNILYIYIEIIIFVVLSLT